MKNVLTKAQVLLADLALAAGVKVAKGKCMTEFYQPKVPKELKK